MTVRLQVDPGIKVIREMKQQTESLIDRIVHLELVIEIHAKLLTEDHPAEQKLMSDQNRSPLVIQVPSFVFDARLARIVDDPFSAQTQSTPATEVVHALSAQAKNSKLLCYKT